MNLFSKPKISVEKQLSELASIGLHLTDGIEVNDLFLFDNRETMEKQPYNQLITALGYCTEDGEDTPFCSRLWMCDYECIEDHGAYLDITRRLQGLSDGRPGLTNIQDSVDIEENKAWVEFDLASDRIHWHLEVKDDWLDPNIFLKYDSLLAKHTDLRIYSNHTDFGQTALLGCFTKNQFDKFRVLSKVRLIAIAEQT